MATAAINNSSLTAKIQLMVRGDARVGKTSLVLRFTDEVFPEDEEIAAAYWGPRDVAEKDELIDRVPLRIRIKDQDPEFYRTFAGHPYRGAHGIIVAFDVCDQDSFDHIPDWLAEIDRYANRDVIVALVGTKSDLPYGSTATHPRSASTFSTDYVNFNGRKRVVTPEAAKSFAHSRGLSYIECSAFTGRNVSEVFLTLALRILARHPDFASIPSSFPTPTSSPYCSHISFSTPYSFPPSSFPSSGTTTRRYLPTPRSNVSNCSMYPILLSPQSSSAAGRKWTSPFNILRKAMQKEYVPEIVPLPSGCHHFMDDGSERQNIMRPRLGHISPLDCRLLRSLYSIELEPRVDTVEEVNLSNFVKPSKFKEGIALKSCSSGRDRLQLYQAFKRSVFFATSNNKKLFSRMPKVTTVRSPPRSISTYDISSMGSNERDEIPLMFNSSPTGLMVRSPTCPCFHDALNSCSCGSTPSSSTSSSPDNSFAWLPPDETKCSEEKAPRLKSFRPSATVDSLYDFPLEIQALILSFLPDIRDVCNLAATCKPLFKTIVCSELARSFWRDRLRSDYPYAFFLSLSQIAAQLFPLPPPPSLAPYLELLQPLPSSSLPSTSTSTSPRTATLLSLAPPPNPPPATLSSSNPIATSPSLSSITASPSTAEEDEYLPLEVLKSELPSTIWRPLYAALRVRHCLDSQTLSKLFLISDLSDTERQNGFMLLLESDRNNPSVPQ